LPLEYLYDLYYRYHAHGQPEGYDVFNEADMLKIEGV
jgi:hypothetical protein